MLQGRQLKLLQRWHLPSLLIFQHPFHMLNTYGWSLEPVLESSFSQILDEAGGIARDTHHNLFCLLQVTNKKVLKHWHLLAWGKTSRWHTDSGFRACRWTGTEKMLVTLWPFNLGKSGQGDKKTWANLVDTGRHFLPCLLNNLKLQPSVWKS